MFCSVIVWMLSDVMCLDVWQLAWVDNQSVALRTQKLRSRLFITQSWKYSPFKSLSGSEYSHAAHTAKNFFLSDTYLVGPFNFFSSKSSPYCFLALVAAIKGSCVGPRIELGHPACRHRDRYRFLLEACGVQTRHSSKYLQLAKNIDGRIAL